MVLKRDIGTAGNAILTPNSTKIRESSTGITYSVCGHFVQNIKDH